MPPRVPAAKARDHNIPLEIPRIFAAGSVDAVAVEHGPRRILDAGAHSGGKVVLCLYCHDAFFIHAAIYIESAFVIPGAKIVHIAHYRSAAAVDCKRNRRVGTGIKYTWRSRCYRGAISSLAVNVFQL